jgi:hypothetical protein
MDYIEAFPSLTSWSGRSLKSWLETATKGSIEEECDGPIDEEIEMMQASGISDLSKNGSRKQQNLVMPYSTLLPDFVDSIGGHDVGRQNAPPEVLDLTKWEPSLQFVEPVRDSDPPAHGAGTAKD